MLEMIAYKATNGQFLCREPQSDFFLGEDGLADSDLYLTSVDESNYIQTVSAKSVIYFDPVYVRFDINNAKWVEVTPKRTLIVHYERVITQTSSYQVSADNEEEAVKLAPPLNGGVAWTEVSSNTEIKHVEVMPLGTCVSPEPSEGMMGERVIKKPGWVAFLWDNTRTHIRIKGPFPKQSEANDSAGQLIRNQGWNGRVDHIESITISPDLEHLIKLEA